MERTAVTDVDCPKRALLNVPPYKVPFTCTSKVLAVIAKCAQGVNTTRKLAGVFPNAKIVDVVNTNTNLDKRIVTCVHRGSTWTKKVLGIRGSAKHARVGTTTKQIALLVHIAHLVLFNKKKNKGIALRVFDIRTKMKWVILNAKPVKTGNTNLPRVARRATSGTVAMAAVTTQW